MMTRDYMKQTYADNLTAWREYRAQIAQDAETLCEIVQNHRFNGGTPEQAAREIVQAIGADNARVIIASAVNVHEGDGRLSAAVIEWAQGIGWDWEMACNLGLTLDSKMHMCHINQTAEALMNLPEDEPEQPATVDGIAYEIRENSEYNSREVYFTGKPAAETREALKTLKMRWNGKKSCWYGYATAEDIAAAIAGEIVSGAAKTAAKAEKPPKKNKFGVQVGDIFTASWGYDQTQTDFFQVVELVGELSVRVREVYPRMIGEDAVSPMSADRTYKITRDILPPAPHSVFIEDQERGDVKRLKSYDKDGKHPQFKLSSFANAYLCEGNTERTYESWYR